MAGHNAAQLQKCHANHPHPQVGGTEINYPPQNTDASGFFTVSVGSLPPGTYNWRAKSRIGPGASHNLANSGTITLSGAPITNLEMGLMRAGDADNNNVVNTVDFGLLKSQNSLRKWPLLSRL